MPGPFDAALKQLLDARGPDWVGWLAARLGLPPGTAADPFDTDLSVVQPVADKVFRFRPPASGLLHLEAQSSWDGGLADRLFLYNALLDHRHGPPVHTVVLLLRREARAEDLTGRLTRTTAAGREYLRFEYEVVNVWEQSADELMAGGLGTAPLALLTDDARPRLVELAARLTERVGREVPDATTRGSVLTCGFQLLGMRYDEGEVAAVVRGVQNVIDMSQSSWWRFLDNLRAEGKAEGRAEGAREALLDVLREKFAAVPPEVEARIRAATDPDKLAAAVRQVLRINSPDELTL